MSRVKLLTVFTRERQTSSPQQDCELAGCFTSPSGATREWSWDMAAAVTAETSLCLLFAFQRRNTSFRYHRSRRHEVCINVNVRELAFEDGLSYFVRFSLVIGEQSLFIAATVAIVPVWYILPRTKSFAKPQKNIQNSQNEQSIFNVSK